MKRSLGIWLLCIGCLGGGGLAWMGGCRSGPTECADYGRAVVAPDGTASIASSAEELARWLGEIRGASFSVVSNHATRGIFLVRTNSPLVAAGDRRWLSGKGKEAFRIRSEGGSRLWIVGNSEAAIRHGVYYYLERLGCRWYLPNDSWTIIPRRSSVRLDLRRGVAPAYRARGFFGTGGFGGKLPVDPAMTLQARWEKWKERNRFGGDIQIGGHTGEAFLLAHRAEIEAHPEYLAEVGGQRQPLGATTKLCVSNPGLQKLYIADRLAAMRRAVERNPDSPAAMAVSVEPADGGGHCECAGCRAIGSVSDRVFFLANAVARELQREFPGRYASLLAYHEHAAVPAIPLEPNLFIFVVPYGFQRTGLPGDELLQAWARKHRPLGVYDYWAIPDWSHCLPELSLRSTVVTKLRFWHEQGANAFLGESSYSAGNVGLAWYVAARLMWEPRTDVDALLNEFYRTVFGPAEPPMRRMLERWDAGFLLTAHELGLCYQDLTEALAFATDAAIRARVEDFARYVHYLRLWHEYRSARGEERAAATRRLLAYLWRVYDSAMVHSYRMFQLVVNRYEKEDPSLAEEWPLKNPTAPAWKDRKPLGSEEIVELVSEGAQRYRPIPFEPRTYSQELVPLATPGPPAGGWVESPTFTGEHRFQFWMSREQRPVPIEIRVSTRGKTGDRVTVTDPKGTVVLRQTVPPDGQWHPLTIPHRGPGRYRMTVFDQKVFFSLKVPADLPFVVEGGFACPDRSSRVYFHVPSGLRRLVLYADSAAPMQFFDGDGRPVPFEGEGLLIVEVPPGQDGRVWSLQHFKSYSRLRPLNFPAAFAFSPGGMLVPAELTPGGKGRDR